MTIDDSISNMEVFIITVLEICESRRNRRPDYVNIQYKSNWMLYRLKEIRDLINPIICNDSGITVYDNRREVNQSLTSLDSSIMDVFKILDSKKRWTQDFYNINLNFRNLQREMNEVRRYIKVLFELQLHLQLMQE